jgi:hypothetical protein
MVVDEHRFDLYTEWGLPIEQVFQGSAPSSGVTQEVL